MKIESVNVTVFQYPTRRVSDSAGHSHPGGESMAKMAMLTITADDGAQGFSFAPPEVVRPFVVNTFFRKVLVGQDPFNRERIWQDLVHWQRGSAHQLTERALSFVEQALWDLIGRSLKMPVYKLLGGYRDTVPAYGSTMCGDDLPGGLSTPEEYAAFAEKLVARGYKAIKLHTWMPPISFAPNPKMDIKACAAVRGDEPGGTLRLGSMETTAAIRLPQVLPAFHRRHPAVQLVLDTLPTRQAVSAVLEYRLDAAFVCGPVTEPGLEGCPVWCEAPCLIAEAGLSLAEATVAPVLLTFGAGCAYRDRLEDWCRVRGIVPATVLEFRSFQAILGCVAAGMGIALLPRSVLDDPASAHLGLAVHDLPAEAAPMQTWLVWRRGWQSPALRALCASLPADGAASAAC